MTGVSSPCRANRHPLRMRRRPRRTTAVEAAAAVRPAAVARPAAAARPRPEAAGAARRAAARPRRAAGRRPPRLARPRRRSRAGPPPRRSRESPTSRSPRSRARPTSPASMQTSSRPKATPRRSIRGFKPLYGDTPIPADTLRRHLRTTPPSPRGVGGGAHTRCVEEQHVAVRCSPASARPPRPRDHPARPRRPASVDDANEPALGPHRHPPPRDRTRRHRRPRERRDRPPDHHRRRVTMRKRWLALVVPLAVSRDGACRHRAAGWSSWLVDDLPTITLNRAPAGRRMATPSRTRVCEPMTRRHRATRPATPGRRDRSASTSLNTITSHLHSDRLRSASTHSRHGRALRHRRHDANPDLRAGHQRGGHGFGRRSCLLTRTPRRRHRRTRARRVERSPPAQPSAF